MRTPLKLAFITCLFAQAFFLLAACDLAGSPVETTPIDVPASLESSQQVFVELVGPITGLEVARGSDVAQVISGTAGYSDSSLKPVVQTDPGKVHISTPVEKLPEGARVEWKLALRPGLSLAFNATAPSGKGSWELGGLSVRDFNLTQKGGDETISFGAPNPIQLPTLKIEKSAGNLTMRGLAYSGTGTATITGAGGRVELHFDGRITGDSTFQINLTGGELVINSEGNPVQAVLHTGDGGTVERGAWAQGGEQFQSPQWALTRGGPRMRVEAGVKDGKVLLRDK